MPGRWGGGIGVVSKPGSPAPSSTSSAKISKFPRRVLTLQVGSGATIDVGDAVVLSIAEDASCRMVVLSDADTAGHEEVFVGVYGDEDGAGVGGEGSATTRTGFSGKQGTEGDLIEITMSGVVAARVINATATAAILDAIHLSSTAGALNPNGTQGGSDLKFGALLQAMTTTEDGKKLVLLRSGF